MDLRMSSLRQAAAPWPSQQHKERVAEHPLCQSIHPPAHIRERHERSQMQHVWQCWCQLLVRNSQLWSKHFLHADQTYLLPTHVPFVHSVLLISGNITSFRAMWWFWWSYSALKVSSSTFRLIPAIISFLFVKKCEWKENSTKYWPCSHKKPQATTAFWSKRGIFFWLDNATWCTEA